MKKLLVVLLVSFTLFLGCSGGGDDGGGGGGGGGAGGGGSDNKNPIQLTEGVWTDGSIAAGGEQWFKFTATNEVLQSQYIHIELGTLTDLYVQVYGADGTTKVGSQANIYNSSSNKYVSPYSILGGTTYLIKVWPKSSSDSGTYQILFNKSSTAPIKLPANAIELTANVWTDSKFTTSGSHWFKFTATVNATQYIHINRLTIKGVSVQLYNSEGNQVKSESFPNSSNKKYIDPTVTSGTDYYIKVTSNYSSSPNGIYQIGFNDSTTPPKKITLPFPDAVELTAGIWTDGNIPASTDEQWFKFKATVSSQYIHTVSVTLIEFYSQLYDSEGNQIGNNELFQPSMTSRYYNRSVTVGNDYYIRIWSAEEKYKGTYLIGIAEDYKPLVKIKVPFPSATQLTAGTLTNGDTTASDTQWYKFKATAATQYIHAVFGTLDSVGGLYVQLYDSEGNQVDIPYSSASYTQLYDLEKFTKRTLTVGDDYYIKVWPFANLSFSYSGTYQITFNTMPILDTTVAKQLTANTWADGKIPSSGEAQWFKFTVTSPTYIHVDFTLGTLNSSSGVYVYLYDNDGNEYTTSYRLSSSNLYWSPTSLTSGNYYLQVRQYSGSKGTYKIAVCNSATKPAITMPDATDITAADTWIDGNLPKDSEQWFKFTAATTDTQYIHINFLTLRNIYIQMFDSNGTKLFDNTKTIWNDSYQKYFDQAVISGNVYYIRTSVSYEYNGTYKIAFSSSTTTPTSP
jgi:hypothetical protein